MKSLKRENESLKQILKQENKIMKQEIEILKQENERQRGASSIMLQKVLGFVNKLYYLYSNVDKCVH